jgi:alkylation response protein AidB-like acyl-CoA dehydrogenase
LVRTETRVRVTSDAMHVWADGFTMERDVQRTLRDARLLVIARQMGL